MAQSLAKPWVKITSLHLSIISLNASFCSREAVFYGIVSLCLVFLARELGNILPAAMKVGGLIGSPVAGLFVLGMLFPKANSKAS